MSDFLNLARESHFVKKSDGFSESGMWPTLTVSSRIESWRIVYRRRSCLLWPALPALLATCAWLRASVPMNVAPLGGSPRAKRIVLPYSAMSRALFVAIASAGLELRVTTLMDFVEWCTAAPQYMTTRPIRSLLPTVDGCEGEVDANRASGPNPGRRRAPQPTGCGHCPCRACTRAHAPKPEPQQRRASWSHGGPGRKRNNAGASERHPGAPHRNRPSTPSRRPRALQGAPCAGPA
mmetsp:Transcript_8608/g.14512  ORF Transcript_8608/g.14512 Transcript_8608/m.14512 type:complete len:236 (+) Transcript_8608:187-894(+)